MKIIKMNISELKRPERNTRMHTAKQLREFERSVKMFGQIRPIVVDEENVILCGNGLFETLLNLGEETADVYKVEGLTENQKKKLMLADNKIFMLGVEDLDTFNRFLEELQDDLDIPGYDEDVLQAMVADAEEVTEKLSEYGTLDDDEITSIEASRERKEAMMKNSPFAEEYDDEETSAPVSSAPQTDETETSEGAETRKSVVCPECGCVIWL